jgi:hypothetical protein
LAAYEQNYLSTWRLFVRSFLEISKKLGRQAAIQAYYQKRFINDADLPYSRFLEVLSANLKPYFSDQAPAWLQNIELDGAVAKWSAQKVKLGQKKKLGGTLNKLESYSQAVAELKAMMPDYYYRTEFIQRVLTVEPDLETLISCQTEILDVVNLKPDEAFKLVSAHFGGPEYGDVSKSPFVRAQKALEDFKAHLVLDANDLPGEDVTVSLRQAMLEALKQIAVVSVAKRLDSLWDAEVLRPVRFLTSDETTKALFGSGGLVDKFASVHAAAFLEHDNVSGYSARKWDGKPFPFTVDFLKLLTLGNSGPSSEKMLDSYNVTVSAVATVVDGEAREKPERTTLTYKTQELVQTLDNYNYPISKTFVWKPTVQDGEVSLAISLPSLTLYAEYSGPYAFPTFLSEVVKGDLILRAEDFPDHAQQLQSLGVTEIRVLMQADDALPVVRYLQLNPTPLPASIIRLD